MTAVTGSPRKFKERGIDDNGPKRRIDAPYETK